jgi:hypothetical protein
MKVSAFLQVKSISSFRGGETFQIGGKSTQMWVLEKRRLLKTHFLSSFRLMFKLKRNRNFPYRTISNSITDERI